MIHLLLFNIVKPILGLVIVVLIVYVVISWLFAFGVVSRHNNIMNGIWEICRKLCDPLLRPFRRLIPPVAGMDFSAFIVLLLVQLLISMIDLYGPPA